MYKIYIARTTDADYVYYRDTYRKARQLANSQQKMYVDSVEITDSNEVVYYKQINEDRTGWIVEVDKNSKI